MRIAVIGAGAAGCLCAAELKRHLPEAEVTVFEGGAKPLAKVAVTGGGRCNFTNTFENIGRLEEAYPRGARLMKRALMRFSPEDAREWFASMGVPSVVMDDGCVFPLSQDAIDIVRALERAMRQAGVKVLCRRRVASVEDLGGSFRIFFTDASLPSFEADRVVVTTGGSPSPSGYTMLSPLCLETIPPVPSLFTFNIGDDPLKELMGIVVTDATVGLGGTAFRAGGPLLITDWGVSGPAILKLSSYAARHLAENGYRGTLNISWLGTPRETDCMDLLQGMASESPRKQIVSTCPAALSGRLWRHLAARAGLREDIRWAELGSRGMARLAAILACDSYPITGRCRFKDEFVTCGGVSLSDISLNTLESKKHPGLFLAGEVLDVDAITGGFNLQAAWSMAYTAAQAIISGNGGDGGACRRISS
ncbi:MAG: aminoacetone oxidase family FAD-binding enzyme [Bacteroidales bacterium]|nr:aminoacetone oxidase family FAD-binding enzyme [Bacteroidales bacterium]